MSQGALQLTAPTPALARNNRPAAGSTTAAAVAAANAFLAILTDSQRAAVKFASTDTAQRAHWSNFPTGIFKRNGIKRAEEPNFGRSRLTAVDLTKEVNTV